MREDQEKIILDGIEAGLRIARPLQSRTLPKEEQLREDINSLHRAYRILVAEDNYE